MLEKYNKERDMAEKYLDTSFATVLTSVLSESNLNEENILKLLSKALIIVCNHHEISTTSSKFNEFLLEITQMVDKCTNVEDIHLNWKSLPDYKTFETKFKSFSLAQLEVEELRPEESKLRFPTHFFSPSKLKSNISSTQTKPFGAFVYEDKNGETCLAGLFLSDSGISVSAKSVPVSSPETIKYVATIPASKQVLFCTPLGKCSLYTCADNQLQTTNLEFMLQVPDGDLITSFDCLQSYEGENFIPWGGGGDESEPWRFHTGINVSATKNSLKNQDRIFKAVKDDEISEFLKQQSHLLLRTREIENATLVYDNENTLLSILPLSNVHVSTGLTGLRQLHFGPEVTSKLKSSDLIMDVFLLSCPMVYGGKCPSSSCVHCLPRWYFKKKSSVLKIEGVQKIVSLSLF